MTSSAEVKRLTAAYDYEIAHVESKPVFLFSTFYVNKTVNKNRLIIHIS